MDKSALLKRYSNKIPEDVAASVAKFEQLLQKPGILNVKLLANFGKDMELSLEHGTDVFRGLIVQVASEYKVTKSDIMWFHPELCKGRSMYKGGDTVQKVSNVDDFNSSVATYSTHIIDEIGGLQSSKYTIVDMGAPAESKVLHDSWQLSSAEMRSIYSDIVKQKLNQLSQTKRDEIAQSLNAGERVMNSNYNMLYSDGRTYHFFNHAIKPANGKALLNVSPLVGCATITADKYVESDLLTSNDYIDVNTLGDAQRERAYVSCKWNGKNIINTYTMRKPIENYKSILDEGHADMYRMEQGFFSANPVHGKLPTDIVLFLTPVPELIPEQAVCRQHVRDGVINMPATSENISKLMTTHWKTLISKRYVNGNSLILPRSMVEQSLV